MHCLPVVYQLTILLMECLAEQTIATFASCFSKCDESDLDKVALDTLRESIITLIEAAGHRKESLPSSLWDMLQEWQVATEKTLAPLSPTELAPLRKYRRVSPQESAKLHYG